MVQGYTLVHIFIPSIQRNYFTEDVIKERKKADGWTKKLKDMFLLIWKVTFIRFRILALYTVL